MTTTTEAVSYGRWSRAERMRLSGIAGAGTLTYALGVRHAFDADHIAAIDDTTRLMLQRGRRPVGVGFFFAIGHSSVVLVLAFVVAIAAGAASLGALLTWRLGGFERRYGRVPS